ncbi:hypothetical protein Q8A64_16680 [Oxalobacteraceae bacterium R-40]|uniref:Uncharacterized protein n=1 Tax=Keguizhuia sedimenti TaxID=3064264 RepID=A0ABU1BSQ6_9BURK|nr:hypothetical protein [Oxalobacteraceae bacterium R-40]
MTHEYALKLQAMALDIIKSADHREQAINELIVKRGLSYGALRQLKTAQ